MIRIKLKRFCNLSLMLQNNICSLQVYKLSLSPLIKTLLTKQKVACPSDNAQPTIRFTLYSLSFVFYLIYILFFSLDEQRKKKGPDYNRKRAITLDAVFNVTCAKCKTRGHLAKDCFKVNYISLSLSIFI